jgi:hypothetical protein
MEIHIFFVFWTKFSLEEWNVGVLCKDYLWTWSNLWTEKPLHNIPTFYLWRLPRTVKFPRIFSIVPKNYLVSLPKHFLFLSVLEYYKLSTCFCSIKMIGLFYKKLDTKTLSFRRVDFKVVFKVKSCSKRSTEKTNGKQKWARPLSPFGPTPKPSLSLWQVFLLAILRLEYCDYSWRKKAKRST